MWRYTDQGTGKPFGGWPEENLGGIQGHVWWQPTGWHNGKMTYLWLSWIFLYLCFNVNIVSEQFSWAQLSLFHRTTLRDTIVTSYWDCVGLTKILPFHWRFKQTLDARENLIISNITTYMINLSYCAEYPTTISTSIPRDIKKREGTIKAFSAYSVVCCIWFFSTVSSPAGLSICIASCNSQHSCRIIRYSNMFKKV